ncbi:MAG: TetR/AcrR family transcriptional regulator [Burkholderiaceae bacterium]
MNPERLTGSSAAPQCEEISPADMRRRQILDAAGACFARRGFHGASMAEIARTFGMSAGHIYNYFASKEAIIEALVERDLETALDRIDELRSAAEIHQAMVAGVAEGVQNTVARSSLDLEIVAEAARNPGVAATVRSMDAALRARLKEVVGTIYPASAQVEERELEAKIELMLAIFDGLTVRVVRNPDFDRDGVVREVQWIVREMFGE